MNKKAIENELKEIKARMKADEARAKELSKMLIDDSYEKDDFEFELFVFCRGSVKVTASPKTIKENHPKWYKELLKEGSLKESITADYLKLK